VNRVLTFTVNANNGGIFASLAGKLNSKKKNGRKRITMEQESYTPFVKNKKYHGAVLKK